MEVDRHADRALYLQLADVLRENISSGQLKPGERLPSESELIERHGVSRGTAREAIGTLRGEGLVVVEHGRGAFVRAKEIAPLVRRVASGQPFKATRLQFEEQTAETGQAVSIREITAGTDAPRTRELSQPPFVDGEPVHEAWLGFADGRPITLTHTWHGGDGLRAGDRIEERISARMPTREERRLLQLDDGSPVLELTRALWKGDTAVELSLSLCAAERQSLAFHVSA